MHPLDQATRLRPAGAGRLTGRTSEAYWNVAGPFGGVTAGTLMGAVLAQERRRWDFVALAVFCDLFFGRIFHVQGTVFPAATVSLTAYFHAAAAELEALGAEPLLGVADATIFEAGFFDQTAQLWSRAGRLLATTTQIVSYRA